MTKTEKQAKYLNIPLMAILTFMMVISIISFSLWAIVRIHYTIEFEQNCSSYLTRAKQEVDFDLAANDIEVAINYLETHGLDHGVIKIFREYSYNDLAYVHQNLIEAQNAFRQASSESELEKFSLVQRMDEQMKLPCGISIYGKNLAYFWWAMVSFISTCVFGIWRMFDPYDVRIRIR